MKTTIIILAACLFISTESWSQDLSADKVPAPVQNAFKAKFPSIHDHDVKWGLEDKTDYEAKFKENGTERSVTFNKDGKWLETETEIESSKLPKEVSGSVAKNFPGYKIKEASQLETPKNAKLYEVELTKDKEILEVQLKPNGDVLKKTAEKEEKEEKD